MPIARVQKPGEATKTATLVCVNHADVSHADVGPDARDTGTTMIRKSGWFALCGVEPDPKRPTVARSTTDIHPVWVFSCEVCGYVEMYSGDVIDPNTWG